MNAARKLPLRWTAAWLLTLGAAAVSAQTQTPQQIAQKAFASTVLVVTENAEGETAGVGSGFFVRSGLIATNRHVIDEAAVIRVRLVNQDRFHRVDSVAAQDAERDLALLRVSSLSAPALPLGDSDALQVGETIYAVGNPIGFLEGTFSNGLVSGIRALPDSKLIQMTAPISPGSSGGPVLNEKGEVVGISTMAIELGQNLNFAVPSNAVKKMMERISRPNLIVPTPRPKPTVPTFRPKPAASPDRFADYMKWSLPIGAKARLGKGSARAIAYSPDGKTLAVGGSLGIWLYDAHTGAEIALFEIAREYMSDLQFIVYSPDGKTIASVSGQKIRIWDAETGALLKTLKGHIDRIYSVAFSPDGKTIAIDSRDKTIPIWDAETGALLKTLKGHTDRIYSVAFSPDGKIIASGSEDKTIRIWDAKTGALIRTLTGHADGVPSIAFSPDGKTIASGSGDKTIRIWDAETGAPLKTLAEHVFFSSVAYSPDGRTLISKFSEDIHVWDAKTGALLKTMGHTDSVSSVAYSPDGKTISSVSNDQTIWIWDAETGALLKTLKGHMGIYSVAFSPDGKTIASTFSRDIQFWDAKTGAPLKTLDTARSTKCLAYSPDGKTIASTGWSGRNALLIHDVRTGALLRAVNKEKEVVDFLAYSPDGRTLTVLSSRGPRLWNASTGADIGLLELVKPIPGNQHGILSVFYSTNIGSMAYSLDGRFFATIREEIDIWNANTNAHLRTIKDPMGADSLAYSPDGRTIAVFGGWELGYWSEWSPDDTPCGSFGPAVLKGVAGATKTIRIWDAHTGALLRMLTTHMEKVIVSIAYSPDGKTLASGIDDGTILLWDISNL